MGWGAEGRWRGREGRRGIKRQRGQTTTRTNDRIISPEEDDRSPEKCKTTCGILAASTCGLFLERREMSSGSLGPSPDIVVGDDRFAICCGTIITNTFVRANNSV